MKAMRLAALLLALIVVATAPACAAGAATQTYKVRVEGMTCDRTCPVEVKKSLESISGVRSVQVDYPSQSATIVVDADRKLTTQEMDLSFHNKGYFISSMEPVGQPAAP